MRFNAMRQHSTSFRHWYDGLLDCGEQLIKTYVDKLAVGKCELCGHEPELTKYLHIDHDHSTGIPRGLLCHRCNLALGYIEPMLASGVSIDDIDTYTKRHTCS